MVQQKTKSYKAMVGAVVAGLGAILAEGQDTLPTWLVLVIVGVVAGGTVWVTPNPPVD